jgi:hypothetical protein
MNSNDNTVLVSFVAPNKMTVINNNTFYGNPLTSIDFPSNLMP